jgi:vacuolar-type H+-ATPase subunit I/STV1
MKKHTLPDSLELLLDTMCNTFGGIMFIAIALIVISQFISKAQLELSPEAIDKANMAKIEKNMEAIRSEILALQKQALELQFASDNSAPEKEEVLRELLEMKTTNLNTQIAVERLKGKVESKTERLKSLKDEYAVAVLDLEKRRRENLEQQQQTKKKKEDLQEKVSALESELANLQPRKIRFSQEVSTALDRYLVFLKDNKLYRLGTQENPLENEVAIEKFNFGKSVRMIPKHGTSLSDSPAVELNYLFKYVDKDSCFISLVVDYHSFATLLTTKQYLRNKGFMVNWTVDPSYEFILTSEAVDHRASR